MKLKTLLLCGLSLFSGPPLFAQSAAPDVVGEQLFTPEFLRQHHEALGLTDEQKNWFRDAFEKLQARIAELQPRFRQETEALAALLKKELPDEAAALAQADKAMKVENEMKRAQLALLVQIKGRLTPEQQAKLRELKGRSGAIQEKLQRAQAIAKQWQADGKDLTEVQQLKEEFERLSREGKVKEVEAVLDKVLKILGAK